MTERADRIGLVSGAIVGAVVVIVFAALGWPPPGPMVLGGLAGGIVAIGVMAAIEDEPRRY
jgi:hypothetical protein